MKELKRMVNDALWPYKNWDKLNKKDKVAAVAMATGWIVIPIYVLACVGYLIFK